MSLAQSHASCFCEGVAKTSMWLLIVLMVDHHLRRYLPQAGAGLCRIHSPSSPTRNSRSWNGTCTRRSSRSGWATITSSTRIRALTAYIENMALRKRAWIELAAVLLFALPYTYVVLYYGWDFWWQSWTIGRGLRRRARPEPPLDHQGRLLHRALAAPTRHPDRTDSARSPSSSAASPPRKWICGSVTSTSTSEEHHTWSISSSTTSR